MNLISEKRVVDLLSNIRPLPKQGRFALVNHLNDARERWMELGVGQGDLVLLSIPNTTDQMVEFFAAILSGATPAMLPPNLPSARMKRIVDSFKPKAIVSNKKYQTNQPSTLSTSSGMTVSVYSKHGGDRKEDVIIFTSGTSGHLSACSFSIEKLLLNARLHFESLRRTKSDTLYLNLPIYYSFALVAQVLAAYIYELRLVVGSSPFNVRNFASDISKFDVTGASLTPVLAKKLLATDQLASLGLSFLTIGGDKISASDVEGLMQNLANTELFVTYGLTEAGPRVSTLAAHEATNRQLKSVGTPLLGVKPTIHGPNSNGIGQLCLTSPTTADAMYKDGQLVHDRLQTDGKLLTGDLFLIEDDYLFFKGRLSNFIVQRGEKINLRSVRQLISEHSDVVSTRTVIIGKDGSHSYELIVHLGIDSGVTKPDIERHIAAVLRRCEYPADLSIEYVSSETPEVLKI